MHINILLTSTTLNNKLTKKYNNKLNLLLLLLLLLNFFSHLTGIERTKLINSFCFWFGVSNNMEKEKQQNLTQTHQQTQEAWAHGKSFC